MVDASLDPGQEASPHTPEPACWQDWVRREARSRGLTITSGYRTPLHEIELGGTSHSWHCQGDRAHPGALDVGGSRPQLEALFFATRKRFFGRIRELFLNVDEPHWRAIKNNVELDHNPEAGRAHHLHVAISPWGS